MPPPPTNTAPTDAELAADLAPAFELVPARVTADAVVVPAAVLQQLRAVLAAWPAAARALTDRAVGPPLGPLEPAVVAVEGPAGAGKTALLCAVAASLGRPVARLRLDALARVANPQGFLNHTGTALLRANAVALVEWRGAAAVGDGPWLAALAEFAKTRPCPLVVESRDGAPDWPAAVDLRLRVPAPDRAGREALWELYLPAEMPLDSDIDVGLLAARHLLTGAAIRAAVGLAWQGAVARDATAPAVGMADLDAAAGAQAGQRRSERGPDLAALVARPEATGALHSAAAALRNRAPLRASWGVDAEPAGPSALFILVEGPVGAGKTWAARCLAGEVGVPLLALPGPLGADERRDQRRAFLADAAAASALLLCDDAEALFGRRAADSHALAERMANHGLGGLIDDLAGYDGGVVFATSLVGALDPALLRRVALRVALGDLDAEGRAACVRLLLPSRAPLSADVDVAELGRTFALPPARMRTAIVRACHLASAEGSAVLAGRHLHAAMTTEAHAAGIVIWAGAGKKPERWLDEPPPEPPVRLPRRS